MREYDRSVFEKEFCKKNATCGCMMCSKTPVVVLSPNTAICKQHDISLRNVKEFVDGGLLEPLEENSFLVYSCTSNGHTQISICAALAVEDCLNGVIKRHEDTTKHAEVLGSPRKREKVCYFNFPSRLSFSSAVMSNNFQPINVDPVMVMYRDNNIVDAIINRIVSEDLPIMEYKNEELCSEHTIWAVSSEEVPGT